MQFAEHAERDLGTELQRARSSRMKPGRRLCCDHEACWSSPSEASAATASAFARKTSASGALPDQSRPSPSSADSSKPHAAMQQYTGLAAPARDKPDPARTGRHQRNRDRGSAARAMMRPGKSDGRITASSLEIGLSSVSSAEPPPNNLASDWRDERPGHGLDQPARGERAADDALPFLRLGQHRARHAGCSLHRRCRNAVDSDQPHHLFDEINTLRNIGTPGRRARL